ncbi:MAG: hypothetical protein RIR52_849 [Acidobacteriota bacterium]
MLTLFLSWTVLTTICLLIGVAVVPTRGAAGVDPFDRLVVSVWVGLLLSALALLTVALLFPLHPGKVMTGLTLGGVVLSLTGRVRDRVGSLLAQLRNEYWSEGGRLTSGLIILLPAILIGIYCSREITYFDTGLYHYQMVALLQEYGVLKGAAQIHDRFGFNSSWFALATGFRAQTISGFAVLLSAIHLLVLLRRLHRTVVTKSDRSGAAVRADCYAMIGYLLVLPYLLLENGLANSLSPDLPVCLVPIVITWWIQLTANGHHQRRTVLILGLAVFSIKLSTLPLSGLCVLNYLIAERFQLRRWLPAFGLIVLMTAPLLLANTLTSGCPLYPSTFGCQERLPWARNAAQVEELRAVSSNFSRTEGRSAVAGSGADWVLNWIVDDHTGSLSNISFLSLVTFVSILVLMIDRRGSLADEGRLPTLVFGLIGSAYVLSLAPALRFSIGYLAIIPALLLSSNWWRGAVLVPSIAGAIVLLTPYAELEYRRPRMLLLLVLLTGYLIVVMRPRLQQPRVFFLILFASCISPLISLLPSQIELIVPARIVRPADSDLEMVEAGGFSYYLTRYGPLKNQCWGAPVPCTPHQPEVGLKVIDPQIGLSGGVMPDRFPPQR